jgi:hypothetical protein
VGRRRDLDDLVIDRGVLLRLEWYWKADGSMPGRDEYDDLTEDEVSEFLASVAHWLERKPGERPLKSVVNEENKNPLILAVKVGKRRFPAFEGIPGSSWVLLESYPKEGQKRDKVGDRAIERAVKAKQDYYRRVKAGSYYQAAPPTRTGDAETRAGDRRDAGDGTDARRSGTQESATGGQGCRESR